MFEGSTKAALDIFAPVKNGRPDSDSRDGGFLPGNVTVIARLFQPSTALETVIVTANQTLINRAFAPPSPGVQAASWNAAMASEAGYSGLKLVNPSLPVTRALHHGSVALCFAKLGGLTKLLTLNSQPKDPELRDLLHECSRALQGLAIRDQE